MKILIQRVSKASVVVEGKIVAAIESGILALVGFTHIDSQEQCKWLADKLVNLRIFEDGAGKMNRSLIESGGSLLIVSQFTLYADSAQGRRPSFTQAAASDLAEQLYNQFIEEVRKMGVVVATGIFGSHMRVSLTNDGPVTLMLER